MKYFLVFYVVHILFGINRPGRELLKCQISFLLCEVLPAILIAAKM